MDNVKEFIKNFDIYKENTIVLYGIGKGFNKIVNLFRKNNINIELICDNNKKNWGELVDGIPVISPNHLNYIIKNRHNKKFIVGDIVLQISSSDIETNLVNQLHLTDIKYYINYDEAINKFNYNNQGKLQIFIWNNQNIDYMSILRELQFLKKEKSNYEILAVCTDNIWIHSSEAGVHIKEIVPIIAPLELLKFVKFDNNYLVVVPIESNDYKNKINNVRQLGVNNVISSICLKSHNRITYESLNSIAEFGKIDCALILCSLPKTGNISVSATMLENDIAFIGLSHDSNRFMDYFKKYKTVKIITAIREPIIQNLSELYQEISASYENSTMNTMKSKFNSKEEFFSNFNNLNWLFKNTMMNYYTEKTAISRFMDDFSDNIINLSKHYFDKEKSYSIIKEENIEVFVYQLEKLNSIAEIISSWIGQNTFNKWTIANEASSKYISDSYNKAKKEIEITQKYFDKCYSDPWVKHFYSQSDIEKFKSRWKPHIK